MVPYKIKATTTVVYVRAAVGQCTYVGQDPVCDGELERVLTQRRRDQAVSSFLDLPPSQCKRDSRISFVYATPKYEGASAVFN